MKTQICHERFEQSLRSVHERSPNQEWFAAADIENSEDLIAQNPMRFFDYIVWILFTTHSPQDEEEEEAREALEYLFQKYYLVDE